MGKVEQLMAAISNLIDLEAEIDAAVAYNGGDYTGIGDDQERAKAERAALESALTAALADERQKALEDAAVVCLVKVDRDPEYGGRWGGYGPWQGSMEGPDCAAAIRKLKERT